MGQLEDCVRNLIRERYDSLAAFARAIGIPEHTLYSALSKGLRKTTLSTIIPICTGLDIEPTEIAHGRLTFVSELPKPVFVPVYGDIAAGKPVEPSMAERFFPIPGELANTYPDAFMLRVNGNSMNKVLPDGYLILVDPCSTIDISGKIFVVAVGERNATVKRVILHDNGLTLEPDSYDPTHSPMLFDYGKPGTETVSVIGRVVWHCSPVADTASMTGTAVAAPMGASAPDNVAAANTPNAADAANTPDEITD